MIKNKELAEAAIRKGRESVDYDTIGFPIEYFVDHINQQQIDDNLNWDELAQSYFIESLILGLPVLNIVFLEKKNSYRGCRFDSIEQLIDGKQRLYAALNFINGNLRLENLKELIALNGFDFKDLPLSRQKKFRRISVRAIAVDPKSDISVWKEYRIK